MGNLVASRQFLVMTMTILLAGLAIGFCIGRQSVGTTPELASRTPESRQGIVLSDPTQVQAAVEALAATSDQQAFVDGIADLRKSLDPDQIRVLWLQILVTTMLERRYSDTDRAKSASDEMIRLSDRLIAETSALRSVAYNVRAECVKSDPEEYAICKLRAIESFQQLESYPLLGTMRPDQREFFDLCHTEYFRAVGDLALDSEDSFLRMSWIHPSALEQLKLVRPQMADTLPCMHSSSAWRLKAVKELQSIVKTGSDDYGPVDEHTIFALKGAERYLGQVISKNSDVARVLPPKLRPGLSPGALKRSNDAIRHDFEEHPDLWSKTW